MATPQSPLNGNARLRDVLVGLALPGLVLLHVWELPHQAARHGGLAFLAAWALLLVLLGLPVLLMELMLGRRSRRSPLDGMAMLTREADAPRGWRVPAWGAALGALLLMVATALVAGGSVSFMAREAGAAGVAALAWPLGMALVVALGAGLTLLAPAARTAALTGLTGLVLVFLLLAAASGMQAAEVVFAPGALAAADWRAAARLALLGSGGGLGMFWLAGTQLPRETGLARLVLGQLAIQLLFALLLAAALAPFVAAALAKEPVTPAGLPVWLLMLALVLAGAGALAQLAPPLLRRLAEKGVAELAGVAVVFGAVLAFAVATGLAGGLHLLLAAAGALLLLVLLGWLLFSGWAMKISHARKELALPSEGVYNIWRVAVRIALPLVILWVLAAGLPA